VATGLRQPTAIVATPNKADDRLFVLEQQGRIKIIASDGTVADTPFLNITDKVMAGGEMGLLGLAFHPDYSQNGYFYVNYVNKSRTTVIARYKVSSGANVADKASEEVLLTVKQPFTNHDGGDLVFGPDRYLYAALGDGGSGGDPNNNAQNKNSLLGKILRLDVNGGEPYGIPDDNPFVGEQGARPEIWAYGLRNPWRISFDKQTGELYIADVGQGRLEELNVQAANSKGGENYGWRCYEGNSKYNDKGCPDLSELTAPALEYNHKQGRCSITGGYVYRGEKYTALTGRYFYGDYCNGQIFYAEKTASDWEQRVATDTPYSISAFGQDSSGELYFADYETGSIYQLQDTAN
jgi:glucose/arabinose dehydrogenase